MILNYYYDMINEYYGDQCAKRSGVPYINHIKEGVKILDRIDATIEAKCAYCIHPIFQDDSTLENNFNYCYEVSEDILLLVIEYRNVANRGLSCFQVDDPSKIYLSPLKDVNDMLIADKVQNRKDFLRYHLGTHPKSKELDIYFKNWLRALNVTEAMYEKLTEGL